MRQLLDEVGRLAPPPARPTLTAGEPLPAAAIADAERRIGTRLPPTYVRMLAAFGPFVLTGTNDGGRPEPVAALYAPADVRSVPEWRARVRRAPLGDGETERARANLAAMARDFVVGHAFDTVWVIRAGTHPPCHDGTPSLSGEFLYETRDGEDVDDEDTEVYAGYFDNRTPQCGDRSERLHDSIMGVLLGELEASGRLALVGDSNALSLRFEEDGEGGWRLYLAASSRPR
jgi:hypothetical protein